MQARILHLFLLLLSFSESLGQSKFRLELVQVIMRHGERTPVLNEKYPKDPYNESTYEPLGLAQLTNQGKLTEYRVGVMLRQRYEDFLKSIYHPLDIYAVSTQVDRTKASLQSALAGLYPPDPTEVWNPDLLWLPIPTHYTPIELDILVSRCSEYKKELAELMKTEEIRNKIGVYQDFLKFLSNKVGLNIKELVSVYRIYYLLIAQKSMNLDIPEWCTDEVFQKMEEIIALDYDIFSYTTKLKRLNGGMLIKKFIDNMNLSGARTNPRKMYIYCGHEINIAAFGRAHNISVPIIPDYGSAFIIEKLRDEANNLYIRIILWTGRMEKLITINVPGCDEICPIETYLELVREVTPSDEEMNCLWNDITKEQLLGLFAEKIIFD